MALTDKLTAIGNAIREKNGTTDLIPLADMPQAILDIQSGGGDSGLTEIENIIDESGVLEDTEGSVSEKVNKLLEVTKNFYLAKTVSFGANGAFPTDTIVLDCKNITSLSNAFYNCNGLKYIYLSNTEKVGVIQNAFYQSGILTIETLNMSKFDKDMLKGWNWINTPTLENLKIVPQTIKTSVTFVWCPLLTAESIQSIIDGLATVETAQTLTLHAGVKAKLTEEQLATITSKNWNLAQGVKL